MKDIRVPFSHVLPDKESTII